VLIHFRKILLRTIAMKERFIFTDAPRRYRLGVTVCNSDNGPHTGKFMPDRSDHCQKVAMNQQHFGARMVEGIQKL